MDPLLRFIESIAEKKYNLANSPIPVFTNIILPPRASFLHEHEREDQICYLAEGGVRCFSGHPESEWTSWFFATGELIFPMSGLFASRCGTDKFETITQCQIIRFKRSDAVKLIDEYSDFKHLCIAFADLHINKRWHRDRVMATLNARQRYAWFASNFPFVNQHVQLKHLASFLGITPQSLSRIRSKR